MIPNNTAFKIANYIQKIHDSKNFFAIDKNSFYFEPLYFHIHDHFVTDENIASLKQPLKFGLYSFTTNAKLIHEPKKKVIFSPDSITYQLYGIRSDTMFYINEICKKSTSTFEKVCIDTSNANSPVAHQILKEMDAYISVHK